VRVAEPTGETYAGAGVDIAAGEEAVERIKEAVGSTQDRPEVLGGIGGFGGLFTVPTDRYRQPVLVSSTDGVGTKAMVAAATGRYDTIGIDLVAMCVDDIVCQGAEPLFLLDYLSVGHLAPAMAEQLVRGVVDGCTQAGCALMGGEMAEHPGEKPVGEFDLAGFAVGVVERDSIITGERCQEGDVVLGLPSPGLRCNGYSLARRVLLENAGRGLDDPAWEGAETSVADELLRPSVIYAPAVVAVARELDVKAAAHITGGGLPGNLNRVLPEGIDASLDPVAWDVPEIFREIMRLGPVSPAEAAKAFNLGLGMCIVVAPSQADPAVALLRGHGHDARVVGELVPGTGQVELGPAWSDGGA
jgi:phosphoribosylformylglycinamidine cyclo-ligase